VELLPNGERAKGVVILFAIILVLEVVNLVSSYMQYSFLQSAASGAFLTMEQADIERIAEANDLRESVVGFLYLIASIVSGIIFLMWFRRAYANLQTKTDIQYTPGWAVGSWIVPFINLVRPYQIMKELYVQTKSLLEARGISVNLSTGILGVWWALWLISGVVGQVVFRMAFRGPETIESLSRVTFGQMILYALGIPLALVAIKVVQDYAKAEPLLAQVSSDKPKLDDEIDVAGKNDDL